MMTTEPLNASNSTATRRGAVQLSQRARAKTARKAAAARARTLCKLVWRHVSDAERRPIRNQQNPYADKLPGRVARQTDRRAPADDESRCPKRPVEQRTQPHAPRAYRVTGRRTETGGSPQGHKPSARDQWQRRRPAPQDNRGSTKDRRPVAETRPTHPQSTKTSVAQNNHGLPRDV